MAENAGPLLVRAGLITEADLYQAHEAARGGGITVVEYLLQQGILHEEPLCQFFRERLLVPRLGRDDLARVLPSVALRLPADMAVGFRAVPIGLDRDGGMVIAMSDPADTHALDEIAFFTGAAVMRAVAPATAIARALHHFHGAVTPLLRAAAPHGATRLPPAQVVEDVYGEDTPLPAPVPFDITGSYTKVDPVELAAARTPDSSPEAQAALATVIEALGVASDRDEVAGALVRYLGRLCRRAAFFVVRRGAVAGWTGTGVGLQERALRRAELSLEGRSTFRDIVKTRLAYRGPVHDAPSRDLLITGLGWAPDQMLVIPILVRDRPIGLLYGDEVRHRVPDEHILVVARVAGEALERALAARKTG